MAVDIDYLSLPLISERPLEARPPTFRVVVGNGTVGCNGAYDQEWRLVGLGHRTVLTIDSEIVERDDSERISVGDIVEHKLDGPSRRLPTYWTLLGEDDGPEARLPVTRYEGTFESSVGVAKRKLAVGAVALVPGTLYAFRRCIAHCEGDVSSPGREEEIELIGPRALWTGSSASTDRPTSSQRQPFTDLRARVSSGASATLFLIAPERSGLGKDKHEPAEKSTAVETYSLEVVWAPGSPPSATLFTGVQDGLAYSDITGHLPLTQFSLCNR